MDNDLSSSVRIAVLIDADNTSPRYAEALLEELAKYGTPTIKRAYGDFSSSNLGGWTRADRLAQVERRGGWRTLARTTVADVADRLWQ